MAEEGKEELGFFSAIAASIRTVIVGLLLAGGAIGLLSWNEGRIVASAASLEEAKGYAVNVPQDKVNPANEGHLVHVTGETKTTQALTDDVFRISTMSLRFVRTVEMFQWAEEQSEEVRKGSGSSEEKATAYAYDKKWSDTWIDSSKFENPTGHENPDQMPYPRLELTADSVHLGSFQFGPDLIRQLDDFEPLPVTGALLTGMPDDVRQNATLAGGMLYLGQRGPDAKAPNAEAPQVGDTRVSFKIIPPQTVTVLARQQDSALAAYRARAGEDVLLVRSGAHETEAMIRRTRYKTNRTTWPFRGIGVGLMIIGIFLMIRPVARIADFIPKFGSFYMIGAFLFSFFIAIPLSILTIGFSWAFFQPMIGAPLLVLAAIGLLMMRKIARSARARSARAKKA